MADNSVSYTTRFYVKKSVGAYDPAPLPEFDMDETPHATIAPGDTLCHWSQSSGEAAGRNHYYKVIERTFRFDGPPGPIRVFVLVEEIQANWTEDFN